jgi:hypothetical protein
MHCFRCHGLMVSHRMDDVGMPTHSGPSPGWKCLLCGEVIDAVIAANRQEYGEPTRDRTRPRSLAWSGRTKRKGTKG